MIPTPPSLGDSIHVRKCGKLEKRGRAQQRSPYLRLLSRNRLKPIRRRLRPNCAAAAAAAGDMDAGAVGRRIISAEDSDVLSLAERSFTATLIRCRTPVVNAISARSTR